MTPQKSEKKNSPLSLIIRLVLSFGLLAWIFSKIDMAHTWSVIQNANFGYLMWGLFVFYFLNVVVLLRWYVFIQAMRLNAPFKEVAKWFFIGIFCNLFLPTAVGGDVIKILGLSKVVQQRPKILASVVLDRLSGFAGIVIIAAIMFVVGNKHIPDRSVGGSIIVMTLVSLSITAVLFSHRIYSFCCKIFNRWPSIKDALMSFHHNIALMKGKVGHGILAILLSCLTQILLAYVCYIVAKALNQDIDFFYFMIFSPLVCVVSSLPSIGGLGVREMGWAYLLGKVGVSQGVSVSISLINFVYMLMVGLIGGGMYVASLFGRRVQPHQAKSPARRKTA